MSTPIRIIIDADVLEAELNDSAAAQALLALLPASINLSRWGDEYYGSCGIQIGQDETSREIMEVGELAIWPPGNALCIFFGPTPVSAKGEIRPASSVEVIGKLLTNPLELKQVRSGEKIVLEKVNSDITQNNGRTNTELQT